MAFSLLRHFCVCVAVVSCFYTYAQKPLPSRLPGRIIVHYEKTTASSARGQEISVEHQSLAKLISTRLNTRIDEVKPVFQAVVDRMIQANQTEAELSKATQKSDAVQHTAGQRLSLSRTVVLSLADDKGDLQMLLDRLSTEKELEGFKIIQAEPVQLSYTTLAPNDPLYPSQWSHRITEAAKAWDIET